LKIVPTSVIPHPNRPLGSMPPGVFPYLGGSINLNLLKSFTQVCGGAIVSGKRGASRAAQVDGVLVDPAVYTQDKLEPDDLFSDYDSWLARQRSADVPLILTDSARIPNRDRLALRQALGRWESIKEPTMVVLPIEHWWIKDGLSLLAGEVRAAGRPVAIALLDRFNGLDAANAVSGLLTLIAAVEPIPVVLLRCDVSAIGAVAHGAFGGFVGCSDNTRHGPLPMRRSRGSDDDEPDLSPGVLVPALHKYFKASRLPAFSRSEQADVLRCHDAVCEGRSLLDISQLSETDPISARLLAYRHNVASTEMIAQRIFSASEPRDSWWETCKSGANLTASLTASGISLPPSPWLRQWIQLGSPSHEPEAVA
jgi:hypothetical protein